MRCRLNLGATPRFHSLEPRWNVKTAEFSPINGLASGKLKPETRMCHGKSHSSSQLLPLKFWNGNPSTLRRPRYCDSVLVLALSRAMRTWTSEKAIDFAGPTDHPKPLSLFGNRKCLKLKTWNQNQWVQPCMAISTTASALRISTEDSLRTSQNHSSQLVLFWPSHLVLRCSNMSPSPQKFNFIARSSLAVPPHIPVAPAGAWWDPAPDSSRSSGRSCRIL